MSSCAKDHLALVSKFYLRYDGIVGVVLSDN